MDQDSLICTSSWVKDNPDHRDWLYGSKRKVSFLKRLRYRISSKIDLTDKLSPIENQRNTNSCTANGIAKPIEMCNGHKDVSRLFLYYEGRKESGRGLELSDNGACPRDVLKAAAKGIPPEEIWPFQVDRVNVYPSFNAYEARVYKIDSYRRITNKYSGKKWEIHDALVTDELVVFGMTIYPSFFDYQKGIYKPVLGLEKPLGGHLMVIVGHDYWRRAFKVANSWGENWGEKGYCWIPYSVMLNSGICSDFWAVKGASS